MDRDGKKEIEKKYAPLESVNQSVNQLFKFAQ